MRTYVIHGLAALGVMVVAACSNPQQPKDPINADPKPQQAFSDPEPQARGIAIDHGPGSSLTDPSPQQSALPSPTPQKAINDPEPQKPFYGPGTTRPEERETKAKQPLSSDGEVLSFAMALNDVEVQMAEMAKKNAESSEVKNFAAMMSTHHQQSMGKIRSVQGKSKIQLETNDLSAKVKSDADQNMAMLRDKKGKEFDRLYIDSQVRMHQDALDQIDAQVLPAVSKGEVKTSLNEMRRSIQDHLTKAKSIQKKLDPTTAEVRTDDADDANKSGKAKTGTAKGKAEQTKDEAKKDAKDVKQDAKKGAKDVKEDAKDVEHDVTH
jgi:putative membrane protein